MLGTNLSKMKLIYARNLELYEKIKIDYRGRRMTIKYFKNDEKESLETKLLESDDYDKISILEAIEDAKIDLRNIPRNSILYTENNILNFREDADV